MRLHHNHKNNDKTSKTKKIYNLSIYLSIAKVYQPRDPTDAILQISTDRPLHK